MFSGESGGALGISNECTMPIHFIYVNIVVSFSLSWLSVYLLNNAFKRSAHSEEMFSILFCYFQLDGFEQSYTTALLPSPLNNLLLYKIKYLHLVYFVSSSLIRVKLIIFSFTQKINSVSMHNSSALEFDAV